MANEKLVYTPKDPKLARTLEDLLQRINDLKTQIEGLGGGEGGIEAHAVTHEVSGGDEVGHDNLTGFVAHEHIDWTNATEDFKTSGMIELTGSPAIIKGQGNTRGAFVAKGGKSSYCGIEFQKSDGTYVSTLMVRESDGLNGIYVEGTGWNHYWNADGKLMAGIVESFPIGSVFLSVVSTNPATLLGYGTWVRIAEGRMFVGQKSSDADFDVAEETGGAKTINNRHRHYTGGMVTAADVYGVTHSSARYCKNQSSYWYTDYQGSTARSVMNPYFVVYTWKRTA